LIGDYAFAVWDPAENQLTLARDHLGVRPLFFHRGAGFVMFASMPSALFTNANVPMDLDDEKVALELAAVHKSPWETFYRGIERVQPGHAVVFGRKSSRLYRHWRPETIAELRYRRGDDYVDAFREILRDAVSARLRTIHPVGTHLSSGWDSSTVTATAASILGGAGRELTAFTAVPPETWQVNHESSSALTNEGPLAALVAARFSNVTHALIEGPATFDLTAIDRHASAFEHPKNAVFSIGWHERLHYDARHRGIRVMLSAAGGNRTMSCTGLESLSGMFRKRQWPALVRELIALRKTGYPIRRSAADAFGPYLPEFAWAAARRVRGIPEPTLWMRLGVNPTVLSDNRLKEISKMQRTNPANSYRMDDLLYRVFCTTTPDFGTSWGSHLAAYDIDFRDPSTDRRLVAFRAAIPEAQFLNEGQTKWLLRRAMAEVLPAELMLQKNRGQQAAEWFDTARLAGESITAEVELVSANPRLRELFDVPLLHQLTRRWPEKIDGRETEIKYRRLLIVVGWARFMRHFLHMAAQRSVQTD
jgi:asparagine synthase (glutamine-hydrolysing)